MTDLTNARRKQPSLIAKCVQDHFLGELVNSMLRRSNNNNNNNGGNNSNVNIITPCNKSGSVFQGSLKNPGNRTTCFKSKSRLAYPRLSCVKKDKVYY